MTLLYGKTWGGVVILRSMIFSRDANDFSNFGRGDAEDLVEGLGLFESDLDLTTVLE